MTTAYCFHPLYLEHESPGHPERPQRLITLMRVLTDENILTRMQFVEATSAPRSSLEQVHTGDYIDHVAHIAKQGGGWLDPDTYLGPSSFDAACLAAGGLLNTMTAVLQGRAKNGFAFVRPPGHHACPAHGMGFCLFNNIAIAARYALSNLGAHRVLIVDWDVHHGNGTQEIFYNDPAVLFFSTHQYPFYPGTGHWQEIGSGAGKGYTVNVPLPSGVGDLTYARVFDEVLTPIARRFSPELILVSAGYDAHWRDPLAGMQLSVHGFAELTRKVRVLADELCDGRLVLTLEGGYDAEALAYSVLATLTVLLGDDEPPADPLGPSPRPERSAEEVLTQVKRIHCLTEPEPPH
jgi:acetoin utilization deacetylase AcuC-like enzyme